MYRILPTLLLLTFSQFISGQCDELFISTYVEGFGNNRSVEIYNPTDAPVDLGQYTIGRFRNGSTAFSKQPLPSVSIAPYDVFVVTIDKRDPNGAGFETPVWDGFQLWDVVVDDVTGDTLWVGGDPANGPIFDVQYDMNGFPLTGDVYREFLDLQGKTDEFINPVYNVPTSAMYFNGDDAVALLSGVNADPSPDGSNILDVVGVIADPDMLDGGDLAGIGWVDFQGNWLTRDRTLVRNSDVQSGTGPVVDVLGDTLDYSKWTVYPKNTFDVLQFHGCTCDPGFTVNTIDFADTPVSVYPNPNGIGELYINSEEPIEQVLIFDMLGKIQNNRQVSGFSTPLSLSTSTLAPGVYIVRVDFQNGTSSVRKVIIQ